MNDLVVPGDGESPSQPLNPNYEVVWDMLFELRVRVSSLTLLQEDIKERDFEVELARISEATSVVLRFASLQMKQDLKPDLVDICIKLRVLKGQFDAKQSKKWSNRIKLVINQIAQFLHITAPFVHVALPAPDVQQILSLPDIKKP